MERRDRIDLELVTRGFRTLSPAWQNAKNEYDEIREVVYTELRPAKVSSLSLAQVIRRTIEFVTGQVGGGVKALSSQKFVVDYELRANLDRASRYSIECVSLSFKINWANSDVVCEWYNGVLTPIVLNGDLQAMVHETKVKDVSKLAATTGLNYQDVREAKADQTNKLLQIISSSSKGQNKLARLVKGCLIYLDRLEYGSQKIKPENPKKVKYEVEDLVKAASFQDTAYVFVTDDNSDVYGVILYAMCQAYPHNLLKGCDHVTVPADAGDVRIVEHVLKEGPKEIWITAQLVWSSMVMYCDQFKLGKELEAALIIACSLRENRYLKKVALPRVVSQCDLIYPAMSKMDVGVEEKTWMSLEASRVIGRFHQMMCLNLFKDIDTCASNSSSLRMNKDRTVRALLGRDPFTFIDYLEGITTTDVLQLASGMVWMRKLDDDGLEHIRKYSVFEGFWAIKDPRKVLQDGMIRCLKKGHKHGIGLMQPGLHIDTYRAVIDEVAKGCPGAKFSIPEGGYNISLSGIRTGGDKDPVIRLGPERTRDHSGLEFEVVGGTIPCPPPLKPRFGDYGGWEENSDSDVEEEEEEVVPIIYLEGVEKKMPEDKDKGDGGGGGQVTVRTIGHRVTFSEASTSGTKEVPPKNSSQPEKGESSKGEGRSEEEVRPTTSNEEGVGKGVDFRTYFEAGNGSRVRRAYTDLGITPEIWEDEVFRDVVRTMESVRLRVSGWMEDRMRKYGMSYDELDDLACLYASFYDRMLEAVEEDKDFKRPLVMCPPPPVAELQENPRFEEVVEEGGDSADEVPPEERIVYGSVRRGRNPVVMPSSEVEVSSPVIDRKSGVDKGKAIVESFEEEDDGSSDSEGAGPVSSEKLVLGGMEPRSEAQAVSPHGRVEQVKSMFEERVLRHHEKVAGDVIKMDEEKEEGSTFGSISDGTVDKDTEDSAVSPASWWVGKKLMDLDNVFAAKFLRRGLPLGRIERHWQRLVSFIPVCILEQDNVQLGDIRMSGHWHLFLVNYCRWFEEWGEVRVEEYPVEYAPLLTEIKEALEARENSLREDVAVYRRNFATAKNWVQEAALKDEKWQPTPNVLVIANFKGICRSLITQGWWRDLARGYLKQKEGDVRPLTSDDFSWFATYVDEGGNPDLWSKIRKYCIGSEVLKSFPWAIVCEEFDSYCRTASMLQKKKIVTFKMANSKDNREQAYMVTSYDDDDEDDLIQKEEYNRFVNLASCTNLTKLIMVMVQLVESKKMLVKGSRYRAIWSLLEGSKWNKAAEIERILKGEQP